MSGHPGFRVLLTALTVLLMALPLWACQPRGQTEDPIFVAVRANDTAKLKSWLADGGDPNLVSRDGDALIYVASGPKGGVAVASTLIAAGANVNVSSRDGRTPLQNAVSWCDVNMVVLLLAAGADKGELADPQKAGEVACHQPLDRRQATLALLH